MVAQLNQVLNLIGTLQIGFVFACEEIDRLLATVFAPAGQDFLNQARLDDLLAAIVFAGESFQHWAIVDQVALAHQPYGVILVVTLCVRVL